jgi:trimethylamine---corrinoid protein Co-methyltransferase
MRLEHPFLAGGDRDRVHRESLRILAEVGVRFLGDRALPILEQHGARVDRETCVARIPGELVDLALATAPSSFVLGARNPVFDHPLPSGVTRYAIDGTASFVTDFVTGERRYGERRDIEDALRVFQRVDLGVMAWAPTCASDAPAPTRPLHEFVAMAAACSKHGQHEIHRADQVPYLEAALTAIMGSEGEVRARHAYSLIYCPVAPLTHDGEMLDAYLDLGRLDLPVMIMPMPVAGSTGPASLFANIAVANAEALSSIVVYQLAHPGRPLIYSSATGTVDFRSGAFLGGTPEMGIMSAALTTMGRSYGLPSSAAGCTSDAREPGAQAVIEKLVTTLPPVIAGAEIVVGLGEIEGDQNLVLEQILVDEEIARACERLVEGVDVSQGSELYDDILEVGPGGNFLAQRSTRSAARSREFLVPRLSPRTAHEAWMDLGRPSIYSNARDRVKEILAGPFEDRLPDAVIGELDRILAAADRDLA